MFRDPISLHYTGSSNQTETHDEVTTAVTHVKLVLDSLTPALAKQLSKEVHDLCFDGHGRIYDSLSKITVRLREPQQAVVAKMAIDASPHVELRNVRIPTIVVTKRGEDKGEEVERKSRKVAPATETLRATLSCLMLPESQDARAFLCQMPGKTFYFEFEAEEKQLDFGPDPEEDDETEGEQQPELDGVTDRPRRGRRQTALESDSPTDAAMREALMEVSIELKPKALSAMTPAQRVQTIDWIGAYQLAREQNNPELPAPPSFIANPKELTEAGDVLDEPKKAPAADDKPARARRKPAGEFANRPKLVKGKGKK